MSNKTVAKLFEEAGDMAIQYVAQMRDLTFRNIQADELHSFVAARSYNVEHMMHEVDGAGTNWGWLAMCADSKFIFAYHIGDRGGEDGYRFIEKVYSKLKRAPDGSFVVRPQINTDGHHPYRQPIEDTVGAYGDHGVLLKRYEQVERNGKIRNGRFLGADRIARLGNPRIEDIHTSYIERQNLNVRMQNRRFTRKTNAFSKTRLNHERHLALWIAYHNLCWVPYPTREEVIEDGKPKTIWIKRMPAAMAAGLTDRIWEVDDLLDLTDKFTRAVRPRKTRKDKLPAKPVLLADPTVAPYWVYQPFRANQPAKVHAASCCNCRGGQGRNVNASGKDGKWWGFATREEADAEAARLKPGRVETCRMCLAERRRSAGVNSHSMYAANPADGRSLE